MLPASASSKGLGGGCGKGCLNKKKDRFYKTDDIQEPTPKKAKKEVTDSDSLTALLDEEDVARLTPTKTSRRK